MPKYKSAGLVPEVTGGGAVRGYASTFDRTPDSTGDVVAPGAFARTLREWAEKGDGVCIPLLYGHKTDDPEYNIGRVTSAAEDERGLLVEAEFDPDNPKAQYVRKLVKEGRLYQFSFAYATRDQCEVVLEGGAKANELLNLPYKRHPCSTENLAIHDALPESVRAKAKEAERRYHQWLDYQCEDYWKSGIVYDTTSKEG